MVLAIESAHFRGFPKGFEMGYDSKPALGISPLFDVIFLFKERTELRLHADDNSFRKPGAPRLIKRKGHKFKYPYAQKKKTESFNTIHPEWRTG
jgi:hypothetical protein